MNKIKPKVKKRIIKMLSNKKPKSKPNVKNESMIVEQWNSQKSQKIKCYLQTKINSLSQLVMMSWHSLNESLKAA